jgi:polyisoprenoid-binding protein YceI
MKHIHPLTILLAVAAAWMAFNSHAQSTAAAKPGAAMAASAQKLVPSQSSLGFVSRQMGVPVQGKFTRFDLQSNFDPKKPELSKVSFSIDLTSADLGNAETEVELKKPGWFDSTKRPQASFVSSAIKSLGAGKFELDGQLTIKGATQRVVIPLALTQSGDATLATGAFQIKRLDFKIGDGDWNDVSIVANEVQVNFKLTLTGVARL